VTGPLTYLDQNGVPLKNVYIATVTDGAFELIEKQIPTDVPRRRTFVIAMGKRLSSNTGEVANGAAGSGDPILRVTGLTARYGPITAVEGSTSRCGT